MNYRRECEALAKKRIREMTKEMFGMFRFGFADGSAGNAPKELPDVTAESGIARAAMNLAREFYLTGYKAGTVAHDREKEGE